ncbi:hypothetical protein [Opitutus terrae]|uniref:Uncharacterized protein n=1 Tax=Opitutus terrae (strain DSM 11246 / JCM 15787 / PB90-1) TaxID=452637 RepID=B1ZXU9_OPITP|nr:hypothetical protein [Opitutus terrae]ACB75151.1 hypothetical protein Oter_1868 [Opitutus terrae PB90-1]
MKTKSVLLLVGGIVQTLFVGLHIAMAVGIQGRPAPAGLAPDVWANLKASMHVFNGTVLAAVLCFAYISIFKRAELLSTSLGRTLCAFISLLYLQRVGVASLLRGFDVGFGLLLLGLAAVYAFAALPERKLSTASSA